MTREHVVWHDALHPCLLADGRVCESCDIVDYGELAMPRCTRGAKCVKPIAKVEHPIKAMRIARPKRRWEPFGLVLGFGLPAAFFLLAMYAAGGF